MAILCVERTAFVFSGSICNQTEGLAVDNILFPVLCYICIILGKFLLNLIVSVGCNMLVI